MIIKDKIDLEKLLEAGGYKTHYERRAIMNTKRTD